MVHCVKCAAPETAKPTPPQHPDHDESRASILRPLDGESDARITTVPRHR